MICPKDKDGIANSVGLIRLLLEEQSDLAVHFLLRLFVPILRILTVGLAFYGAFI